LNWKSRGLHSSSLDNSVEVIDDTPIEAVKLIGGGREALL
jgi:hypothetical protein